MLDRLRIVDLSVPLEDGAVSEPMPARIQYARHDGEGREQMERFFGVKPEDLVYSEGRGWAIEEVQAITHTGTHVDAPGHFAPGGRLAPDLRLEELVVPAVVVDVAERAADDPDTVVTVDDVRAFERRHGSIPTGAAVLMHSGWASRVGDPGAYRGADDAGVIGVDVDVRAVVRGRVVRSREEADDGIEAVQHVGHVDTPIVELRVLEEQLVEAVPRRGIDHVAVVRDQLIDQHDVRDVHPTSGLFLDSENSFLGRYARPEVVHRRGSP